MTSVAASILTEAATIVDGARQQTHGDRERSFGMIADMWAAYLAETNHSAVRVVPEDVAVMMALLKVARFACGKPAKDHFLDGAAYLALAGELAGVE